MRQRRTRRAKRFRGRHKGIRQDICQQHGKVCYESRSAADRVRGNLADHGTHQFAYFDESCGWWHLTSRATHPLRGAR
jgi:hypothetical protein